MASWTRDLFRIRQFTISLGVVLSIAVIGLVGPILYPKDPFSVFRPEQPPSLEHPLGTDTWGRDLLAQLLTGIRGSLYIGVVAGIIATIIGIIVGLIAGFKGGVLDSALMLVTNVILIIPTILLLILIAAYFKVRSLLLVALIIGVTSWPWLTISVRAQIMSLREREFMYMSRIAGLSSFRILIEDLLPNIASYTFMSFILMMGGAMIAEAGLSMIGLGSTSGVSLGLMLFWAEHFEAIRRGLWWWFIPPGAVLVVLTTALLTMVTALDEFFNPRLREQ